MTSGKGSRGVHTLLFTHTFLLWIPPFVFLCLELELHVIANESLKVVHKDIFPFNNGKSLPRIIS